LDLYLATVYCREKLPERGQAFARRYEGEFHEAPNLFAAQAYDGARLLFEVLQRAPHRTPTALRDELERTMSFDSVAGPISWKDHITHRRFFLVRIKGGTSEVLQTVEPANE
jgi:branched-chain amino acid transport system substrate-binding protein